LLRMAQKDERQTIATASITMAIFICYIRTSKSIMAMFSTESINGVAYLKVLYLPLLTSRRAYVRTRLYLLTYVLTYLGGDRYKSVHTAPSRQHRGRCSVRVRLHHMHPDRCNVHYLHQSIAL
jgi:hypothetical protein